MEDPEIFWWFVATAPCCYPYISMATLLHFGSQKWNTLSLSLIFYRISLSSKTKIGGLTGKQHSYRIFLQKVKLTPTRITKSTTHGPATASLENCGLAKW